MAIDTETRIDELDAQFAVWCKAEHAIWEKDHPRTGRISRFAENMGYKSPRGMAWSRYIVPRAKSWWRERGYIWNCDSAESPPVITPIYADELI